MAYSFWLCVHLLSVMLWVGGMFFALGCLRPALADLQPQLTTVLQLCGHRYRVDLDQWPVYVHADRGQVCATWLEHHDGDCRSYDRAVRDYSAIDLSESR